MGRQQLKSSVQATTRLSQCYKKDSCSVSKRFLSCLTSGWVPKFIDSFAYPRFVSYSKRSPLQESDDGHHRFLKLGSCPRFDWPRPVCLDWHHMDKSFSMNLGVRLCLSYAFHLYSVQAQTSSPMSHSEGATNSDFHHLLFWLLLEWRYQNPFRGSRCQGHQLTCWWYRSWTLRGLPSDSHTASTS